MGFKSGEYGGRYFGCQRCQFVALRRCHVALSTIKILVVLSKVEVFLRHNLVCEKTEPPSHSYTGSDTVCWCSHERLWRSKKGRCACCGWSIKSVSCLACWPLIMVILPGRFLTISPSTPQSLKALIHFRMARLVTNRALQTRSLSAPAKSIWMAVQRVAVSLDPTRETSLSSSIVAFSGFGMSNGRAMYLTMAHCSVKV